MRKVVLPIIILVLIGLDQLSKWWVVSNIALEEIVSFLPGVFSLTYLRNYGAAFSMLQNQQWLFALITFAVVGFAFYYLWKHLNGSYWLLTGLSLIIAGGLGNFIDRVRLGYVVDMVHLDFMDFAIFNVADSYLTVGVIVLMIAFWKEEENESNR
ncbi:signal peptidase II [Streptococcus loxodontisalivarius]|uniref:Lipoprotein signal peptidase n=1 Tax=Streptococcus loxodontisalivarius TaxID=1349415 RepID=A0ABS2PQX8_9STRE|nr:signal peptidase II [Streptococcus loxodontisalivarius]MBM7642449.1 signal peptidase II [Streptococcus loxodontisalivarius]